MDGFAPRSGIGILPHGVCHLSFPLASTARLSRSAPKPALSSCRLNTDCRRASKQVSSQLFLELLGGSSFDSSPNPHVRTAAAALARFSARNFAGPLLSASILWNRERLPALNADLLGDEEARGTPWQP